MKFFKAFTILLALSLALTTLPFQEVYAKDNDVKKWASQTLQPSIESNIKSFNDSWDKNWNVNIAAYIVDGEKYKTLEKLEILRKDIKSIQKDIKEIKVTNKTDSELKKKIKTIKQDLNKVFSVHDKQVKKVMNVINKDKKIKNTTKYDKQLKKVAKQMNQANETYAELHKELKLDVDKISFNEVITINKAKAEEILAEEQVKKDKAAKKKAEKEEKLRIENENKIIAELEKELADLKATHKEKTEALTKEITDLKAQNSTLTTEVDSLKKQVVTKATSSAANSSDRDSASSETESFQNCTELRKKYPNGVASNHPAYQSKMDRDKDGWACER